MKLRLLIFGVSCLLFLSDMVAAQAEGNRPVAPNLTFTTTDGKPWSLHDNRGRILVLNFWATWCGPCRTEVPYLVKIAEEYKMRGVSVAGVSLDDPGSPLVAKFAAEYKVNYPILLPEAESPFFKLENVPMTLVIDAEGRLAQTYKGAVPEKLLRADLEKLIGKN